MENQLCRVCLVTNVKMFNVQSPAVFSAYLELTGISDVSGYPHICYECVARLLKCEEFRIKCFTAHDILTSMVNKEDLQTKRKQKCLISRLKKTDVIVSDTNDRSSPQVKHIDNPEIKIERPSTADTYNCVLKDYVSDAFSDDETACYVSVGTETKKYLKDGPSNKNVSKRKVDETKDKECSDATRKKPQKKLSARRKRKTVKSPNKGFKFDLKNYEEYFTVVHMSTEDAIKEVESRKETKNYQKNKFKCTLCCRGFELEKTYNNHLKKHDVSSGKLECEFCHLRFPGTDKYRKHINRSHKHKFICKTCSYICFNLCQANLHKRLHKGIKYTCDICNQEFSFPNTLLSHKRIKHATEAVCELCGDTFRTTLGRNLHVTMHHKQETNAKQGPQCVECDVHFATESAWKRHLVLSAKHQTQDPCKEKCDICGITFPGVFRLKKHLRNDACEDSSNPPNRRKNYNIRAVQSCVCEICGEKFKHPCYLEYHRIKHTGTSPHTCDICGKAFPYPKNLELHINSVHTDSSAFKCDLCNKEFKAKVGIIKHIKSTHLNIRPHNCDICGKAFHHRCEVKYHKQHVHDNVPRPKRIRTKHRTEDE